MCASQVSSAMVEPSDSAAVEMFHVNDMDENVFRLELVRPHLLNMLHHFRSMPQSYLTKLDVDLSKKQLSRDTQCVTLTLFTEQVIYSSPALVQGLAVHEVRAILTRIRLEP